MDEPLASLDAPRKAEILPFIERLRDELRIPIVYVSHAMEEIVRLADTLVLLSEGKVAAVGAVEELDQPTRSAPAHRPPRGGRGDPRHGRGARRHLRPD